MENFKNFREKVLANGKSVRLNLANDFDYKHLLDLLGGAKYLRENFPQVYQIVLNTRAYHEKNFKQAHIRAVEEIVENDYVNSAKIRYVNFDLIDGFSTSSSIHRTAENPHMIIVSNARDVLSNKLVDGFAIEKDYVTTLAGYVEQDAGKIIQAKDKEFEVSSTFIWIEYDENGQPIFETIDSIAEAVKILGYNALVDSLVVKNPDTVRYPTKPNTTIVYDRQAQVGDQYDYYYPLASRGNDVIVQVPFNGSVQFTGLYKPVEVIRDTFRMQLEHPVFGVIEFGASAWNKIKWNVNGNTLSWEFPDDWETLINKQSFVKGIGFDFYCEMQVRITLNGIAIPTPIPIVMLSDNLDHADSSFKNVKPIDIYWGCIGKDTEVCMADHSLKAISDIKPGDFVLNESGESVEVKDVTFGNEEQMVYIESETGENVLLTEEHPILTQRGMVMAKNLNAADFLIMENQKAELRYVYPKEYNDKVYNLVLEKPANIIGNGFIIGDFNAQQEAMAQTRIINSSKRPLQEYQKEIKGLIGGLHAKIKSSL